MNKRLGRMPFMCLLMMMLLSASMTAKTNKGTIDIEVGETYYIDLGYGSGYTVSGYWTKTDGRAFIITSSSSGNGGCAIKGNQVGTSTLNWKGFVSGGWNTWNEDFYWTVNVKPKSKKVTDIIINKSSLSLVVGGQEQLIETVLPANASNQNVIWESSNNNVAEVGSWGLVTGKSKGSATISCKALDGSGVKGTCTVSVVDDYVVAEINSTYFPDENFRNHLLAQDYGSDGKLMASEITKIQSLNLNKKEISDLKGIECFVALKYLRCNSNKLTSLDVSKCTSLTQLQCQRNQLTSLDVTKNTFLVQLQCEYNQLTSLDVTKNTALKELRCDNNQITNLDVSYCTELEEFWCSFNQLELLDLTNNTKIKNLDCGDNQLIYLDVTSLTSLVDLSCGRNKLSHLDLSNNHSLTYISCNSNQIRGAGMDQLVNSIPSSGESNKTFYLLYHSNEGNVCTKAQAATAKAKGWTPLSYWREWEEYFGCDDEGRAINETNFPDENFRNCLLELEYYGTDGYLAPTEIPHIGQLFLAGKNIGSLKGIEYFTALEFLRCYGNRLTELDLSKNTMLKDVDCGGNLLTSLDVSYNTALKSLWCGENKISGASMDALINSLPINSSENNNFGVYDNTRNKEENICTKAQVAAAKARGWEVLMCTSHGDTSTSWTTYKGSEDAKPESITLPSTMTVAEGQTITLIPTITPSDAITTLTWSSDDETIATVNSEGVVTGVKKGQTFINVETDNGKTAYCKLTVTAPQPTDVSIPKTATVNAGETITLTATLTPANAVTTLTWQTDDPAIATVDANGNVTGLSEGLAIIMVSTANGLTSNACKLTVNPPSGIEDLNADSYTNSRVFSLSGQRLAAPKKGINIIGRKKVVVK